MDTLILFVSIGISYLVVPNNVGPSDWHLMMMASTGGAFLLLLMLKQMLWLVLERIIFR